MRAVIRLQNHPAAALSSAASAASLLQKIIGHLAAAVIAAVEHRVCVEDPDQRHPCIVKPLGDHLRAKQDIRILGKLLKQRLMRALRPCRIRVHAHDARLRKTMMHIFFQPLRPHAQAAPVIRAACGAMPGQRPGIAADMAFQAVFLLMIRKRHFAVRAFQHLAA